MATKTTHLRLNKPDYADKALVSVLNSNMDAIDDAIYKGEEVSMIANGDFENPINTNGQSVYTASGMCINAWRFRASNNSTVVVADGSIRMTTPKSVDATTGLYQTLVTKNDVHRFKKIAGKKVTLAVEVKKNTFSGNLRLDIYESNTHTTESGVVRYGYVTIPTGETGTFVLIVTVPETMTAENLVVAIRAYKTQVVDSGYIEFAWADLYPGEYTVDNLPKHKSKPDVIEQSESGVLAADMTKDGKPLGFNHAYNNYRFYVNAETGNDNNDGLSDDAPFKTLQKVFDLCNGGRTEVRVYITAPGTYTLDYNCYHAINTHISGSTGGVKDVTIKFLKTGSDNEVSIYGTHHNFGNVVLDYSEFSGGMRFETASIVLRGCAFVPRQSTDPDSTVSLAFADCYINAKGITIDGTEYKTVLPKVLISSGSTANFENVEIDYGGDKPVSVESGSRLKIEGTLKLNAEVSADNKHTMIYCYDAILHFNPTKVTASTTNKYKYGIHADYSIVNLYETMYTRLLNSGACNTVVANNRGRPSLFIAETTKIGGSGGYTIAEG